MTCLSAVCGHVVSVSVVTSHITATGSTSWSVRRGPRAICEGLGVAVGARLRACQIVGKPRTLWAFRIRWAKDITRSKPTPRDVGDQSGEKTTFPNPRFPGDECQFPTGNHPLDDPFDGLIDDLGETEERNRGFVCRGGAGRPLGRLGFGRHRSACFDRGNSRPPCRNRRSFRSRRTCEIPPDGHCLVGGLGRRTSPSGGSPQTLFFTHQPAPVDEKG